MTRSILCDLAWLSSAFLLSILALRFLGAVFLIIG